MAFTKDQLLTKQRLTIPELNKDEKRWKTLVHKLKHDPFFLSETKGEVMVLNTRELLEHLTIDGKHINMDSAKNFLKPSNKYAPVFVTNKGRYKLNEFRKTKEFGGGTGASLGTVYARIYETIQAMFFSLRQHLEREVDMNDLHILYETVVGLRGDDMSYFSSKSFSAIIDYYRSNKEIKEEDLHYFEERGWIYTFIKIANEFYRELAQDKKYIFYQAYYDKGLAKTIHEAYKRCIKNVNEKNNMHINVSRWNPSDIWAVRKDMEETVKNELDSVGSITELNVIMDSLFDKKMLVGISLKKILFGHDIQLIINKTLQTNFVYDYSATSIGPFDKLTVRVHSRSYSWLGKKRHEMLDARIYTGKEQSNMFLEIRGSSSKYGKASLTYVNSVLQSLGIRAIPRHSEIEMSNSKLRSEIIKLHQGIQGLRKTGTLDGRFNIIDTRSKLISKYQALLFVEILERYKKKPLKNGILSRMLFLFSKKNSITNHIVREIFYYAYSMGDESLFDNAKYFRIKTIDMNQALPLSDTRT